MLSAVRISRLLRVLALLAGEGASLALLANSLVGNDWLQGFIVSNELSSADRNRLLAWLVVGALIPCVAALAFLVRSFRNHGASRFDEAIERVHTLGRLFAFSLLAWAVPQMTTWAAWVDRDLIFLVSAAFLVVAFERALRVSLDAAVKLDLLDRCQRAARDARRRFRVAPNLARFGPHLAVGVMSAGYVAYTGYYTVLKHLQRQSAGFDLGYFGTYFWNTIHGRPFYCPITHPRDGSYLSIHAEFAVYLLAPFYALSPKAQTLLIMQSALLGLSAVPLYLFARRRLKNDALAALVAIALLFYPPLHSTNFTDFHFLTISVFFVLWSAYFFETERWFLFWPAVIATLTCREDVSFGGIGIGLALVFSGWRVRTGAALALVSTAYLVLVKFVVMPSFGSPSFVYVYERLVPPGESGFRGVLGTLLTNPLYTLSAIFLPEKLPYLLHVFVPVAFLPLRMKRFWFLLFPGFFVTLLSTGYAPVVDHHFQYVMHFTPYVFLGAVLVLEELGKLGGPIWRGAAFGALAAGSFLMTHQFGALQKNYFFFGGGKVSFDYTDQQRENLRNLREVAATIPKNAVLAATEFDCAHLAEREYLFTLKYVPEGDDYVLYGYDNLDFGEARSWVRKALETKTHGFHAERPGFVVLRRGAPADRNAELLSKL